MDSGCAKTWCGSGSLNEADRENVESHACLGRDFDEWVEAALASDATETNAQSA
jgi:hypothetical protein